MGKWKAVSIDPDLPLELYDLEADISESNNIAGQHPEVIEQIENYLRTARSDSEHRPGKKRA